MTGARHTTKVRMLIAFAEDQDSHPSITCESHMPVTSAPRVWCPILNPCTQTVHIQTRKVHIFTGINNY